MIALNHNHSSFYNDSLMSFFNRQNSLKEFVHSYVKVIKQLRRLDSYLDNYIENLDINLELNGIDTVNKIDDFLIRLEQLTEINEQFLSDEELDTWYYYPIRYLLDKVEDSNYSLQGLLSSKQAELSHDTQ